VASAKAEVITRAGSVFLCSHDHQMDRNAILAPGTRSGPASRWTCDRMAAGPTAQIYMTRAGAAFTAVRLRCGLVVSGTFAVWPATGTGCVEPSVG